MRGLWLVFAALLGLAAQAHAADEATVLRQRAEQLAAQDRCAEATERAQRARELAPQDARAALVVGRCALREARYTDAIEPLEAARRLDSSLEGIATDLAQAHFHLNRLDRAETEVARALERDPDDARALLYRGLVLLRRAENAEAAEALDRASRLDPRLGPTASLYAGLAWEHARDRERAAAALQRARAADPDGAWGREAGRALERLDAPYRRHRWARLQGGLEHDSNVALSAGRDPVTFVLEAFDERQDLRGVFEGELGVELLRRPEWSGGVIAGYQGNAHTDLHDFDLQYPWLVLWLDHRLDERTWLRLQPFAGYQWLETDPFVVHGGAQLSVDRELTEALLGRVFARYNYNDYLFRIVDDPVLTRPLFPAGVNADAKRRRDRDGSEVDTGVELELAIARTDTTLRGGSAYELYHSEGKDWRYDGVRSWVGADQDLPARFRLELFASFAHRSYDHRSSFDAPQVFATGGGSKRTDNVWELQGVLERPITDVLTLGVRASYGDYDSNIPVFDYDRYIVGGYFTLEWGS